MVEAWDWPSLLTGLGLFLFGMSLLEKALQSLSERKFKQFLRKNTASTFGAVKSGAFITAILQSSSLVSLMSLALVGAGVISFKSAIGIVWGSNLGTTITGWLFTLIGFKLKLGGFASICIFVGALVSLTSSKGKRLLSFGHFCFAFGVLVLGLSLMKTTMMSLSQEFKLSEYTQLGPYLFFPIGVLLTATIQSSSATMVLVLSALNSQIVSLPQAFAIIIGSDIGTTITIFIGSINGISAKKRVAWSHFLFNCFNSILFLILLFPLTSFTEQLLGPEYLLYGLVGLHTVMNFTGILILGGFLEKISLWLERLIPDNMPLYAKFIHQAKGRYPQIVTEAVRNDARLLIYKVVGFSLRGFGFYECPDNWSYKKCPVIGKNFLEQYDQLKHIEGEVLDYYLQFQVESDQEHDNNSLYLYVESIKKSLSSAKHLKDIHHNIERFSNSGRDKVYDFYLEIRNINVQFYERILEIIDSEDGLTIEQLDKVFTFNREQNDNLMNKAYTLLQKHEIKKLEASTLLLLLREIYSSNKGLLLAVKDLHFTI